MPWLGQNKKCCRRNRTHDSVQQVIRETVQKSITEEGYYQGNNTRVYNQKR